MRQIFLILLSIIYINVSATNWIAQADSAYTADRFINAIELYERAIAEDGISSDIYYNLGNAYYRAGKLGKSIVCYERAIILDPTNVEAINNLDFVNGKITDKPGDKGTFISNFFDKIINSQHSNSWAVYGLIAFLLLIASIAIYVFTTKITFRKLGFFSGLIFIFATVVFVIFALISHKSVTTHNKAIITSVSTILSTSPRQPKDRGEEAMLLHEGTKVEIIDSVIDLDKTKWYDVKVDNSHRAWLNSKDAEII